MNLNSFQIAIQSPSKINSEHSTPSRMSHLRMCQCQLLHIKRRSFPLSCSFDDCSHERCSVFLRLSQPINCIKILDSIAFEVLRNHQWKLFKVPSDFPRIIWSQLNIFDGAWHHGMMLLLPAVRLMLFYFLNFKLFSVVFINWKRDTKRVHRRSSTVIFHYANSRPFGNATIMMRVTWFCWINFSVQIWVHMDKTIIVRWETWCKKCGNKIRVIFDLNCLCFLVLCDARDYYFGETEISINESKHWCSRNMII